MNPYHFLNGFVDRNARVGCTISGQPMKQTGVVDRDIDRMSIARIEAADKALCPREKTVYRRIRILLDREVECCAGTCPCTGYGLALGCARESESNG